MSKKRKKSHRNLPIQNRRHVAQSSVQQAVPVDQKLIKQEILKFTSGPIPDPESLMKYEQIESGLANRIVAMAEKQQEHLHKLETSQGDHRRDLESRVVIGDQLRARIGQISASVIGLSTIAAGTYVAVTTSVLYGSGIIGAVFAGGLLIRYVGGRDHKNPAQTG